MEAQTVMSPVNVEARKNLDIRSGDTVRVMQKIQEKGKTRLQAFEGLVLSIKHGKEAGATFTVRKVASGVGVEKTFPLYSPNVDQILVIKRTKVRQSKLYYIREKAAKVIRRSMRNAYTVGTSIESDIAEKDRVVKEAEEVEKARVAEEEKRVAEEKAVEEARVAEEEASKKAEEPEAVVVEEKAEEVTEEKTEEAPTEEKVEESKEESAEAPAEESKKD